MEQSVNEHYRQLLQLPAPWKVEAVDADLLGERVAVRLVWPEHTAVACPVCGRPCGVYDRLPERSWRHLSVMQYLLELRCAVPRGACPEHGVKTVAVPWAERAVARGLARRSTAGLVYVGLDEKSFGRGQAYVSLLTDLLGHRVLEVVPGRDEPSACALWQSLPEAQRQQVAAAAMDMGANFAAATRVAAAKL